MLNNSLITTFVASIFFRIKTIIIIQLYVLENRTQQVFSAGFLPEDKPDSKITNPVNAFASILYYVDHLIKLET